LNAGWHTLEVTQADTPADAPTFALTWKRPNERSFTPFPNSLLAQAARGIPGKLENVGSTAPPDISVEALGETPIGKNDYAQRYVFEAVFPEVLRPSLLWEFDDGQTSSLRRVNHIFLTPGVRTVKLTLQMPDGKKETTTLRLTVRERMVERLPKIPIDPPAVGKAVLAGYNLEKISPEEAFRGMQLLAGLKEDDLRIAWGTAWLKGVETRAIPTDEIVVQEAAAISRLLVVRKRFKEAAEVYRLAAAKPIGMETRLNLARWGVITLCDDADDPITALKEARLWQTRAVPSNRNQVKIANVALAYAYMASEDGKSALAALETAVKPPATAPGSPAPPAPHVPTQEDFNKVIKRVQDAMGKKDVAGALVVVNQWELDYPQTIWEGSSRLLRTAIFSAEGRPATAARLARQHAMANPDGPNAAQLLLAAAVAYRDAKDEPSAKVMLQRLRERYPNSPFARQAATLPQ
jgi:PKD repeat protein